MIVSASRRTDIPAFYSEWFMNRLKEGYVLIPNPRNANRLGHAVLSPENVDCIVFWTKNPIPMLDKLKAIDEMGYAYYIQFTLTPYDNAVEPGLPPKRELLQAFIELSERTDNKRAVWRYDPVFIDEQYTVSRHLAAFSEMCAKLQGYTERCVLSFIDVYRNIRNTYRATTEREMHEIAEGFAKIAKTFGVSLYTCSEEIDLSSYGIGHSACIDQPLVEQIIGRRIKAKKDVNQRPACRCIESVDVGAYDTCAHSCTYCYAVASANAMARRTASHSPDAPMITGYPRGDEIITDRTTPSQIIT